MALNLLGGLAGAVSGISDIVGEEEEKTQSEKKQAKLQKAPVPVSYTHLTLPTTPYV